MSENRIEPAAMIIKDDLYSKLPEPVWEKIFDAAGRLLYEGYTINHKAAGPGKLYDTDGKLRVKGIFGLGGLIFGKVWYPNGLVRFEGQFISDDGYDMNCTAYGTWYGENGELLYEGEFTISRNGRGWPEVIRPERFGPCPDPRPLEGHIYLREDAAEYQDIYILKKKDHDDNMPDRDTLRACLDHWLRNPYWNKYYITAPSQLCREYIALKFWNSHHPDYHPAILEERKRIEDEMRLEDWQHLLEYCGNNPWRLKVKNRIKELSREAETDNRPEETC